MPRLLISAAHKSSGKTTVSLGLCAAFKAQGLSVQPFKKGPDYIDPMWLSQASGRPCHNLDFYTMERDEILSSVIHHSKGSDLMLTEGNKGLYDGLDLDGSNSNAALAKLCAMPVILVIDARGMTRGIAPLILGYQAFDAQINIAGVILNQLGGSRHESKLRAVIEHYTSVPVLGAVHRDSQLEIVERHLGLMPSNEDPSSNETIANVGTAIAKQVNLEQLLEISADVQPFPKTTIVQEKVHLGRNVRIGIAKDPSFGFYYPDDINALKKAGATLVPFNTLTDSRLPEIDGLFIGGGFPETQMKALEANASLRSIIKERIEAGLPTYAECGGLMYLSRSLTWGDQRCAMVGIIPTDILMHERPQGRGYVRLQETNDFPWPGSPENTTHREIAAHEFHYSTFSNAEDNLRFAYDVLRGSGIDGKHDGVVIHNLLACYAHQRDTRQNRWASRFVEFVDQCSSAQNTHVEIA